MSRVVGTPMRDTTGMLAALMVLGAPADAVPSLTSRLLQRKELFAAEDRCQIWAEAFQGVDVSTLLDKLCTLEGRDLSRYSVTSMTLSTPGSICVERQSTPEAALERQITEEEYVI